MISFKNCIVICFVIFSYSLFAFEKYPLPASCVEVTDMTQLKDNVYVFGAAGLILKTHDFINWDKIPNTQNSSVFAAPKIVGDSAIIFSGISTSTITSALNRYNGTDLTQINSYPGSMLIAAYKDGDTILYSGLQFNFTSIVPAIYAYDLKANTLSNIGTFSDYPGDAFVSISKIDSTILATTKEGELLQISKNSYSAINFGDSSQIMLHSVDDTTCYVYNALGQVKRYDRASKQLIDIADNLGSIVYIGRFDANTLLLLSNWTDADTVSNLYVSNDNGKSFQLKTTLDDEVGTFINMHSKACILGKKNVYVFDHDEFTGVSENINANKYDYKYCQEQLSLPNLTDIAQYSISDIEGIQVSAGTLLPGGSIDLSGLPANTMYFVSLHTASHSVINFKVLNNYISVYNSK